MLKILISLIIIFGCTSPTEKEQPDDNSLSVSEEINSIDGGTVKLSDGTSLYICPDALDENSVITISKINDLQPNDIALWLSKTSSVS